MILFLANCTHEDRTSNVEMGNYHTTLLNMYISLNINLIYTYRSKSPHTVANIESENEKDRYKFGQVRTILSYNSDDLKVLPESLST